MGGNSTSITSPRIANLLVQTSALGIVIPVFWGTGRLKVNLLWYNGFVSTATTTTEGGKGGGGVSQTTYTYSADVIMGICAGPIDGVSKVFVNKSQFNSVSEAGLSLATGAVGQAVWGHLTTAYPSEAIGYSGVANLYAAGYPLSDQASLPNHSVEAYRFQSGGIGVRPDANPADIVSDALTNSLYGVPGWGAGLIDDLSDYSDYCLAANLLLSPVLDAQVQASQFLADTMQATNSNCYWSEGLLKVRPYGDFGQTNNGVTWIPDLTPIYFLDEDEMLDQGDHGPVKIDKKDQSDAYNIGQVEYLDRSNQYNTAIAVAQDLANISAYGPRKADPVVLHAVADAGVAQNITQLILQRALYIRDTYVFELPWGYALLEQMDLVSITCLGLGINDVLVRIIQIDDDENACRTVTAEPVLVGAAASPVFNQQGPIGTQINQNIFPGRVETNLLLYSQDFTQAAWTQTRVTITSNATTAPDGTVTADKIIPTAVSGAHLVSQTFSYLGDETLTFSIYLKASVRKIVNVEISDPSNNLAEVKFDVAAGTIFSAPIGSGRTVVDATITPAANGFYRCELVCIGPSNLSMVAIVDVLNDSGGFTWTGNGVDGIFYWGAQVAPEFGAGPYSITFGTPAVPFMFNPPSALTPGGVESWAAIGASNRSWGGCNVWLSVDGTNYTRVGQLNGRSRYGVLTASLASHADPDSADTLKVDLTRSIASLGTPVHADADAGVTMSIIDMELISFGAASLTADEAYSLTYLRRGVLNSPIAAHSVGAAFVRCDTGLFRFPYVATQAGQVIHAKFASFNVHGRATQALSTCLAYTVVPVPVGSRPPVSTAWTAVGTSLQANGTSIPAIVITGQSDNPSATAITFLYRVAGTSIWTSAGNDPANTTRKEITSVTDSTAYDVGVQYQVNGVPGQIFLIGTVTTGTLSTGPTDGSVLFEDSVPGAGKTFVVPAGYALGHIEIQLVGDGGDGNFLTTGGGKGGGGGTAFFGGGGGGKADKTGIVATAGSTTVTYTIPVHGSGNNATASIVSPSVSLTAHPGTDATTSAAGTGGIASGGTTNTTGRAGGLTNAWDGGGCGGGVDQTVNGQGGTTPGGGGAGAAYDSSAGTYSGALGANARIRIIART